MAKYRDFSEMPPEALRQLAWDLAHPREAMKHIKTAKSKNTN